MIVVVLPSTVSWRGSDTRRSGYPASHIQNSNSPCLVQSTHIFISAPIEVEPVHLKSTSRTRSSRTSVECHTTPSSHAIIIIMTARLIPHSIEYSNVLSVHTPTLTHVKHGLPSPADTDTDTNNRRTHPLTTRVLNPAQAPCLLYRHT